MRRLLVVNAGELLTLAGPDEARRGPWAGKLSLVRDGAVLVENGRVVAAGSRSRVMEEPGARLSETLDAEGRVVLPGFVDSHTHPVFAAPRLSDFEQRIAGKSYAEIAASGGGILQSVDGVRGESEERLRALLLERLRRFLESGTTTIEAKSGYGLDLENEIKILRVLKGAGRDSPVEIVPTFLGAHAVPPEMGGRREEYVRRVVSEMLPRVAQENLAAFADAFCEEGYFSLEDCRKILSAAKGLGLGGKLHAAQLAPGYAPRLAVEMGAVSADHLDRAGEEDVSALADSPTVACLLPCSNYFLAKPYPPARRFIDAGAAVALATDFNPGTSPCWDMRMAMSLACTQMGMSPAESLVAATINGAWAVGKGRELGSLEPGKKADLICYEARDHRELPYYFGAGTVRWVVKAGDVVLPRP